MNEKQGAGCLKTTILAGAVVLILIGFMVYEQSNRRSPAPAPREPTNAELFLENSPRWDAERLKNLKWIVSNHGRCDEVRTAVRDQTSSIPIWRVHCLGAYSYEVTFDDSGEVVKVRPF